MRFQHTFNLALCAALSLMAVACGGTKGGGGGQAPMALTYSGTPATYIQGVSISPNTAVCNGGPVSRYSVAPELPAGLNLDAQSGLITGTPTAVSNRTTYTVTASNSSGSTSCPVSIAVLPWTGTGQIAPEMLMARKGHSMSLLADGRVLVVGGTLPKALGPEAEIYDPATNRWTPAGNPARRADHRATMLKDGRVLITGGIDWSRSPLVDRTDAEIFDPASNAWSPAGNLKEGRSWHGMTVLSTGKVLVAGGSGPSGYALPFELFDPATGTWSQPLDARPNLSTTSVVELLDGRILVVGSFGQYLIDAALTTLTPSPSAIGVRLFSQATLLDSGKVLVTGADKDGSRISSGTQTFNPLTNTWSPTTDMAQPRVSHAALRLQNGKILVVGGAQEFNITPLNSTEAFDPVTGTWSPGGTLGLPRANPAMIQLLNGKILVTGGATETYGHDWTSCSELI